MTAEYAPGEAIEVQRGITEEWNLGDPWREGIEWEWGPAIFVEHYFGMVAHKVDGFDGTLVCSRDGVRRAGAA